MRVYWRGKASLKPSTCGAGVVQTSQCLMSRFKRHSTSNLRLCLANCNKPARCIISRPGRTWQAHGSGPSCSTHDNRRRRPAWGATCTHARLPNRYQCAAYGPASCSSQVSAFGDKGCVAAGSRIVVTHAASSPTRPFRYSDNADDVPAEVPMLGMRQRSKLAIDKSKEQERVDRRVVFDSELWRVSD